MNSIEWSPDGWLCGAAKLNSPNHDARPTGTRVSVLVVHGISLPAGEFGGDAVLQLFCNELDCSLPQFRELEGVRVSAHFLICRDGGLTQFVSCDQRAWHAGRSRWRGKDRCNDVSVGIELEGSDLVPYSRAQYSTLAALVGSLASRYPIADIIGHSDVAPGRKTDPGASFDWAHFRSLREPPPQSASD